MLTRLVGSVLAVNLLWAALPAVVLAEPHPERVYPARFLVERPDDIVAAGPGPSDWSPAEIHSLCETGVTTPTLKGAPPRPHYTRHAMAHHVSGAALIEAIVGVDGIVENVRLVKSVDAKLGLDEEAMKCARAWKFNPATKDEVPVRVAVTIELTFTLK